MDSSTRHSYYLDELINSLHEIGETRKDLVSLLKEPMWFREGKDNLFPMCDLILIYGDYAVSAELKGSKSKRGKARQQLMSGKNYIKEMYSGLYVPYGTFVTYSRKGYVYERLELQ